jgi:amidase
MDIGDLWRLDATAQAALVRSRELTGLELLDATIARIERVNPAINAVITPLFDEAGAWSREQAARPEAPFAGVPMLLKDASIEVAGTPYYIGTRMLREAGHRSQRTTEFARRLMRAGFVFAGKTNCPEFSAGITTEPVAFGPTRNPWDLTRSAGGSSGGSAAAVAAGLTPIAHGGDGTGSLRYPAAVCGVATLKPTRGLIPTETPAGQPDVLRVWSEFVLARSVRDLAGVLRAVAGVDATIERQPPPPFGNGLRIGLLTSDVMAGIPTHADCVRAVEAAGALLEDLGHHVEEAHPPALDGLFVRTNASMVSVGTLLRHAQLRWLGDVIGRPITRDDVEPGSFISDKDAAAISGAHFMRTCDAFTRETAPVLDWWADGWDVLVTPVTSQPAWLLGSNKGALDSGVFPPPFSFTGQPAMSLPLHQSESGLPTGVQLVGPYGGDALLLRLAAQLEAAAPWAARWPEVAVDPS